VEPQDELLVLIRRLVASRVLPVHQEQFVQVVTITVAQLMSDPRFLNELVSFKQMQQRIAHLTNENLLLKQILADQGRKPPAPRKAPAPRKRAAPKSQAKAFQAGVRDVTRRR
jgi:hypothetical protein